MEYYLVGLQLTSLRTKHEIISWVQYNPFSLRPWFVGFIEVKYIGLGIVTGVHSANGGVSKSELEWAMV